MQGREAAHRTGAVAERAVEVQELHRPHTEDSHHIVVVDGCRLERGVVHASGVDHDGDERRVGIVRPQGLPDLEVGERRATLHRRVDGSNVDGHVLLPPGQLVLGVGVVHSHEKVPDQLVPWRAEADARTRKFNKSAQPPPVKGVLPPGLPLLGEKVHAIDLRLQRVERLRLELQQLLGKVGRIGALCASSHDPTRERPGDGGALVEHDVLEALYPPCVPLRV